MDSARRLYRPTSGRMIGGVAAGMSTYFGMDIAIARILWGILLFAGVGIPIYLLCWIAMPKQPVVTIDGFFTDTDSDVVIESPRSGRSLLSVVKIAVLLIVGVIVAHNIDSDMTVAAFVVGLGLGLYYLWRNRATEESESLGGISSRLHRSESNKRILGVFGGIGETIGVDPTLLRILGGIVLVAGFPVIVPLYLLYAIVVPSRRLITL